MPTASTHAKEGQTTAYPSWGLELRFSFATGAQDMELIATLLIVTLLIAALKIATLKIAALTIVRELP
jgi:hypothetical protein